MNTSIVPATSLPTDPVAWPEWLEQQLVRGDLGQVVVELETLLQVDPAHTPDVRQILGSDFDKVLESGLSVLNGHQITELMKHPRMLLRLQEAVLIQGGDYWSTVDETDATKSAIIREWAAIEQQIDPIVPDDGPTSETNGERASWFQSLRPLVALAAIVLVGVTVWMTRPSPSTWGFDQPGLLNASVSAHDYLDSLADAADTFDKKPLDTSVALGKRLSDFSHGCQTLLEAKHPQLSEASRKLLLEKCRDWKASIDGHLADLNSGAKPIEVIRDEANATVNKLVNKLREMADETLA
ncbi:MAG: hypothetical protein KDA80_03110 [Planctomycetaceae bacterium]|nr:hypothetical protein [Planctomycetaceae bacterium]